MGVLSMTMRRVRKIFAWILAIVFIAVFTAGLFYVVTQI